MFGLFFFFFFLLESRFSSPCLTITGIHHHHSKKEKSCVQWKGHSLLSFFLTATYSHKHTPTHSLSLSFSLSLALLLSLTCSHTHIQVLSRYSPHLSPSHSLAHYSKAYMVHKSRTFAAQHLKNFFKWPQGLVFLLQMHKIQDYCAIMFLFPKAGFYKHFMLDKVKFKPTSRT